MKKIVWVVILLLVIVILLVLYACDFGKSYGSARLGLGPVGYSVWPDGSLAVAIPIVNSGKGAASAVNVATVTLGISNLVMPTTLPASLGEIVAGNRAVLQTRFGGVAVPGSYTLEVSGVYAESGTSHDFAATAVVTVAGPPSGPIAAATTTVPKQKTSGVPTAPSPIPGEFEGNNPLGPPVPTGPVLHPFPVAPTHTGPVQAPSGGSGGGMGVTFIRDTGTTQQTGVPPDPSTGVATRASVVLDPDNTYMLFSVDDGQTFTQIDPTTIFPQSDGGLCCDQVVIYDGDVDLFFWIMQYNATAKGPNRLRIAYAHPADLKTNFNVWSYFDLTVATFNGNASLDYPDIAVTKTYLYASVDGSDSSGANYGFIVASMPLSDITGSGSNIGIGYFSPNESTEQVKAKASRLTQGSSDGMYWGGHVDTSHLEVFHWPDSSGSVTTNTTAGNTYCNSDFSTLAPDKKQWLDNTRAAGTGSIIAATRKPGPGGSHGQVWLGWEGARDDPGCTQGRPQPYVKIAQIDDTTLNSVGEYDIWNTPYAFAYPSLGTAPNGDIGVAVSFGGPTDYASSTVGYLGDYVVYYVEKSDVTLSFQLTNSDGTPKVDSHGNPVLGTRYGDMFAVRPSGPDNTYFSSEGYLYKFVDATSPNCSTAPGCTYRTHYEQFGRGALGR